MKRPRNIQCFILIIFILKLKKLIINCVDIENNKTKLDLTRVDKISSIFNIEALDLLTFDEKQVFNNSPQSGNFYHSSLTHNLEKISEQERNAYKEQIRFLKEEIEYLRDLIR